MRTKSFERSECVVRLLSLVLVFSLPLTMNKDKQKKQVLTVDRQINDLFYTGLQHLDDTDYIELNDSIIDTLGFTDDLQNMLFIIEQKIGKNCVIIDNNNRRITMTKRHFQHLVIVADTPRIHKYFFDTNRFIRVLCDYSNKYDACDDYFMVKEMDETTYKTILKCFDKRDQMIEVIKTMFEHSHYIIECKEKNATINELRNDMDIYERQLNFLRTETTRIIQELEKVKVKEKVKV